MKKALLMDLGNTIVYNKNFDFIRGLKHIYQKAINPKVSYEELLTFNKKLKSLTYENKDEYEISLKGYLNYLMSYCDLKFKEDVDTLELEFVKVCEDLELIPGVMDLLKYCKNHNIKVVVLSNTSFSKNAIFSQINGLGFSEFIDTFLISSEYIFRKPSKAFFELGVKIIDKPKDEVLYVGNDYQVDILGAIQSGLSTCWYNEENEDNYLNLNCLIIKNYQQLLRYLEGNND